MFNNLFIYITEIILVHIRKLYMEFISYLFQRDIRGPRGVFLMISLK